MATTVDNDALSVPAGRGRMALPGVGPTLGLICLTAVAVMTLFAPWLSPHGPLVQNLGDIAKPPTISLHGFGPYPLGTDELGRDLLSRVMFGSRTIVVICTVAVVVGGGVGSIAGMLAGYAGRWVDALTMRLVDVQLTMPAILLALTLIAVLGANTGNLIIVLALTGWPSYARVVRAEVLSVRQREFVQAADQFGGSSFYVITRHILPNVMGTIVVLASLDFGRVALVESALSFLGLGVQPPTPDWGAMLASGSQYLSTAWWIPTMPGVALTMLILGVNLVADWLRDMLNPRIQTGQIP